MVVANATDGVVNLSFALNGNIGMDEYSYSLGDEFFKFLSFDISEVYSLYIEIAETFMGYHYGTKDKGAYKEKLTALCGELDKRCIYLHWYAIDLLNHMTEFQTGSKMAMDSFVLGLVVESRDIFNRLGYLMDDNSLKPYFDLDFMEDIRRIKITGADLESRPLRAERELYRTEFKMGRIERKRPSKSAMKRAIGLAILAVAEDLKWRRELFLGEVAAITEGDAGLDGLSLTQKLYMLDVRRAAKSENSLYGDDLWRTAFRPYPRIPHEMENAEPKDINEQAIKDYIVKNGIEIKQVHLIESMERLIVFEFLNILTSGANIKKCKYCGNYFVPQGRSDTVFCDRVAKGETKPCSMIGSLKLHKAEKIGNPIHESHLKAYRRMNSKARTKRIPQGEFLAWSDEARVKRDACLNGELDFEEFAQWLNADKGK
jgi:hypothetical protein